MTMHIANDKLFVALVLLLSSCRCCEASLFSWLFGRKPNVRKEASNEAQATAGLMQRSSVPFEMQTTDEKFLAAAQLSPLDTCHHMMVAKIQGTCAELPEEELGKLSVQLLNCQSKAEGRTTYTCTDDMTLAECTSDMDATTWNAYQIVANRALAVCHAARQRHFRLHAQHAVNELMETTHKQAHSMQELQEGQQKLAGATAETLNSVHKGQRQLLDHQMALQSAQSAARAHIAGSVRELTRERALIAAGNRELAAMTDDIRHKLDNATSQLSSQEREQRANHKQIVDDLMAIRERAQKVWQKIDESSEHVLRIQNETQAQYLATMANLRQVNDTVTFIVHTIRDMEQLLNVKVNSITELIGGTGDRLAQLYSVVLHIVYLVLAAISAAFLRMPVLSRVALLVLVPLDAWADVQHGRSLGFKAMTILIGGIVILNWLIGWASRSYEQHQTNKMTMPAVTYTPPNSAASDADDIDKNGDEPRDKVGDPDIKDLVQILHKLYKSGALTPAVTRDQLLKHDASSAAIADVSRHLAEMFPSPGPTPVDPPPPTPITTADQERSFVESIPASREVDNVKRHLMGYLESDSFRNLSPSPSCTSTPNKTKLRRSASRDSSRSFSRPLCLATTKQGMPCRIASMEGSAFCHRHQV